MPGWDLHSALVKGHTYDQDISAFYILVRGAGEDRVKLPTGAGAGAFVGLSISDGKAGETHPIHLQNGIAKVVCGATVTQDQMLTWDATGRGVPAAPAAGVNANVVGKALRAGVVGDIIPVQVMPGTQQG